MHVVLSLGYTHSRPLVCNPLILQVCATQGSEYLDSPWTEAPITVTTSGDFSDGCLYPDGTILGRAAPSKPKTGN